MCETAQPKYDLEDLGDEFVIRASLPSVQSAAQAELEASETELRVYGPSGSGGEREVVVVPLPKVVDTESVAAKWSKKTGQLIIRLSAKRS